MSIKDRLPKSFQVGDAIYLVEFVDSFPEDPTQTGLCDSDPPVISIKNGLTDRETVATLVHELCHCFTFEHGLTLKHKLIEKLEHPLAAFIMKNFLNG